MAWRAPVVRRSRLQGAPAAGDGYPCPRYVAALVRGQKDIHRRKFGGLTRPALGGVLAEVGNPFAVVEGNGVHIGPGATLLTRMPFFPNNCARPAEKFAMAALAAG